MAVSVCLSQVGVLSKGMFGLISFFARRLLSTSPTLWFKEIQISTKIKVLHSGTFSQAPDFRKFRHCISIVERAINLARERWTLRAWSTGPSSVNLINNTSELRRSTTLVYRRDRQALSTARFCRAGQLATAGTCCNNWLTVLTSMARLSFILGDWERCWKCRTWKRLSCI